MPKNEIDVHVKIGGEWKALASVAIEQDRRALQVINRLRDMLHGVEGHTADFLAMTERDYADVFEAADDEIARTVREAEDSE